MSLLQVCCGTFSLRANIIIMNKGRILKRQQVRTLLVKMCVPKIFFKLGWRTSVCRNTTKTICIWQCIAMFLMQTNKLFIQQLFLHTWWLWRYVYMDNCVRIRTGVLNKNNKEAEASVHHCTLAMPWQLWLFLTRAFTKCGINALNWILWMTLMSKYRDGKVMKS